MGERREDTSSHATSQATGQPTGQAPSERSEAPGWEEVEAGVVTAHMHTLERPLPEALSAGDEPKAQAAVTITATLMERPAPRGDAAAARKEGKRPNIERRLSLMERGSRAKPGGPPSIGSMDPSRRA